MGVMDEQDKPDLTLSPERERAAEEMLRRIGWDAGQLVQIKIYARMVPARKMEIALRWRQAQIDMLRRQLQAENPDLPPDKIRAIMLQRLERVREPRY